MIRFYNGKVLTMDGNMDIRECELWTDGDKISYIGPTPESGLGAAPEFEREIDLHGNLLMPSFKDAHTHSAMTFLRSYADDLPLQNWLFDKVFPMEAKLSGENIRLFSKLAILEYLTSGITAGFDMYLSHRDYAETCIECGFRSVLCGAISDSTPEKEKLEREYLEFNGKDPLISYILGFHAEYTIGLERLEYVAGLAEKYKAPVYTHNSETALEVENCVKKYGKTPTALFDSLGIYNYGGGGFHCVYMTEEDLDIFKKRGLWAVTNPASNAKLASGIAPISRMMEKKINIAIGTDGAASNNALDMFREMYLVTVLQKIAERDAASCDGVEVLKMATVGSARAMGLYDCDVLAVGKQADMIVIDLTRPNMQPLNNIVKNIVYAGSKENVKMTMVAGKILYENGEFFIGEEPRSIYEKANEMVLKLKKTI